MREWGKVILRAAVILLALFYFCWPVRLSGSSMEPSLRDGDIVLMSRALARAGGYEKGDIVTFRWNGGQTLVKRVIAREGERVRILPEGGVEIDGARLQEPYTQGRTDGLAEFTVPEGTLFLLGDNREISYDSRNMGVISEEALEGKVFFRIYPLRAAGRI